MQIIFLDLETTGLIPHRCQILELAALKVDAQLNPVDGFHRLLNPPHALEGMDPYVVKMHTDNGLFAELQAGQGMVHYQALDEFAAWLGDVPDGSLTLGGDSVHFDLGFLRNWAPKAAAKFSHRLLDLSAFRVAREYIGAPACDIVGGGHRATSDVMASIAKARWHFSRIAA